MPESPKPEPPSLPELLRIMANEWELFNDIALTPEQKTKLSAARSKRTPESPEAQALHALFNRRANTMWSPKEIKAFQAAKATGLLTLENIELIGWFRSVELPKGEQGFCRRSLEALLNNFGSEVDKARTCPEYRRRAKKTPSNVVPMEQPDLAEAERVRAAAQAGALKKSITN